MNPTPQIAVPPVLWTPSEQAVETAQATQFARQMVRKHRLELNSYPDFYRWSIDNPETFWSEVWDFCGVIGSRKGQTVLVDGDKMPGARWFPEARLNFAENLMRRGDRGDAFVLWDERGLRRRLSYSELTSEVSRAVQALEALGLRSGDRAAAFIPNIPEAAILALAAASQGIVWASCSPDFGVEGVLERFGQIEPRCCSAPTATATTARSTARSSGYARSRRSCPRCARWWWFRTSTRRSTCPTSRRR